MSNILQRLGAFRKKFVVHTIDDGETKQEFRFYTPRWGSITNGRTRELIEPLIQSASVVFTGGKSAHQTQQVNYDEAGKATDSTTLAQDKETTKILELQRRNAISDALGILLNEDTKYIIGELLADSLRDDFPRPADPEYDAIIKKFMDEIEVDILVQFVWGYVKAMIPFLDSAGNSTRSGLLGWVQNIVKTPQAGAEADANQDAPVAPPSPTQTTPMESAPSIVQ